MQGVPRRAPRAHVVAARVAPKHERVGAIAARIAASVAVPVPLTAAELRAVDGAWVGKRQRVWVAVAAAAAAGSLRHLERRGRGHL